MSGRTGAWAAGLALAALAALAPRSMQAQDTICDRGDIEVRRLAFSGNRTFSAAELENRIVTTASSRLYRLVRVLGSRRCIDPDELPVDVLRLVRLYRTAGFSDVTVQLDTVRVAPEAMNVTFVITEGEPELVDVVTVTGLGQIRDSARVLRAVRLRPGSRFDLDHIQQDIESITSVLRNSGYPDADVYLSYERFIDKPRTVTFDVEPGPLATIAQVNVVVDTTSSGQSQQIDDAVVRRLLGVSAGDVYSAQRLSEAQRNLFQTDAYRHVGLRILPDTSSGASDSTLTVEVSLIERRLREVRVGGGWGTLDCFRAMANASDRNFLGGARQMEVSARVSKIGVGYPLHGAESLCRPEVRSDLYSDTLNYRVGATIRQPGLFGLSVRNAPSLSLYSEQRSEYRAYFRSVPIGGVATISRGIAEMTQATFSYQLEYGRTEAQPAVYCALFNICTIEERSRIRQQQTLAVAGFSVTRDLTGDARGGSYARVDVRHASSAILSDPSLQFNTVLADGRRFWNLGDGFVLAARVRGGVVIGNRLAIRGPSDLVRNVSQFVPPLERLYGGGPNSVRGFRYNELGPKVYIVRSYDVVPAGGDTVYFRAPSLVRPDRAVPTGGNTLVVANFEARLPSPILGNLLHYALFVDVGEVWNRGTTAGSAEAGFTGLKFTPGAGVRAATPFGPIRVDVGYNPYERRPGVAYFDAPIAESGLAPLYCVSPGNTLKVVPVFPGAPPTRQLEDSGSCGANFRPEPQRGLQRLIFNFSIGQAF